MKRIVVISLVFIMTLVSSAQSLNGGFLQVSDSSNFSFIVSGHFYGGAAKTSGYPASSILGNIDLLNSSESEFIICLGDLFMDINNDIPFYEKSFLSRLNKPLLNAVGNHDLSRDVYQEKYGETFYSFDIGNNSFIVLDTELNDGSIEEEQLKLFNVVLDSDADNVFIFSHRPVWAEGDPELEGIFKGNTKSLISNNFQEDVLPLLNQSKSKVCWFSGSLGGSAPSSFFHHQKAKNLTYIATAIRDLKRDAILEVGITGNKIEFNPISLTGQDLKPVTSYDVDFWKTEKTDKFNYRLIPLFIKQVVLNKSFFIGFLLAIILFMLLKFAYGKRK